jgi:hypothetical protein
MRRLKSALAVNIVNASDFAASRVIFSIKLHPNCDDFSPRLPMSALASISNIQAFHFKCLSDNLFFNSSTLALQRQHVYSIFNLSITPS